MGALSLLCAETQERAVLALAAGPRPERSAALHLPLLADLVPQSLVNLRGTVRCLPTAEQESEQMQVEAEAQLHPAFRCRSTHSGP